MPSIPLPKKYNLSRHDVANEPPLVIFSEAKGGKVIIEGKVECKGELTPVSGVSAEYRTEIRNRTKQANTKTRQIQMAGIVPPSFTASSKPPIVSSTIKSLNTPVDKDNKDKRVRAPKQEVLDRIFAAFASKPYWDLTGLTNYTDQPQVYLKEILTEVCVKHTSGPHRLMYELKAQYKENK